MKLFKKQARAPSPQDAMQKLRDTIEMLDKRETWLAKKIQLEISTARRYASTNRRAALYALKKKKALELEQAKINGARMTLDQQLLTIEGIHV